MAARPAAFSVKDELADVSATIEQAGTDEARRRAEAGRFFGHIAYASTIARRPEPN